MPKRLAAGLAVVGFCLAVLVSRAVWEGRSALADGDAAADRGDYRQAVMEWRRAARWYAPLAPHVGDAYARLETLAGAAEGEGDLPTALAAWRGIRSSVLATRSFYTPHGDRLEPANRNIARLMAALEGDGADPGKTADERAAWHYQLLARDPAPSLGWAVVALIGLALWLGGAFGFALRGVSDSNRLVARPAAIAGTCIGAGLVIWLLGLYNA